MFMARGKWIAPLLAAAVFLFPPPLPAEEDPAPAGEVSSAGEEEDLDEEFIEDLFEFEDEEAIISDPLQGLNRGFFWFNDKLYFYLLKPVARGWRAVAPKPFRLSLGRFVTNLFGPVRAANCLLQWKVDDFGNEVGRLMTNTTVGLLGFFDPAKKMSGIGVKHEDFGQTLGVWGSGPGWYIVLPLLGPSSVRDAVGFVGDFFLDPIYWSAPDRQLLYLTLKAGNYVNKTSLDPDTYESIKQQQLDPYAFIRNAYAQKREEDIKK